MSDILNTLDNFSTATDIVKALREAEYRGYMKAVADRPQGEWIDISEWYAPRQKCSICETIVVGYGSNFCPNCGARMKGADDEEN